MDVLERESRILEIFQAFSIGRLADAASIINLAGKNGVPLDEFVRAVRAEQERRVAKIKEENLPRPLTAGETRQAKAEWDDRAPKCPDCGKALAARILCTRDKRGNRHGYQTHWFCPKCLWERYSHNTIEDELKTLHKEE